MGCRYLELEIEDRGHLAFVARNDRETGRGARTLKTQQMVMYPITPQI